MLIKKKYSTFLKKGQSNKARKNQEKGEGIGVNIWLFSYFYLEEV